MNENHDISFWHNQLMQIILGRDYVKTQNLGSPSARAQWILNESSDVPSSKSNFLIALNRILGEIEYEVIRRKECLSDIIDLISNFRPADGLLFLVKHHDLIRNFGLNTQLLLALGNYYQSVPDKDKYSSQITEQYKGLLKRSLKSEDNLTVAIAIFKMLHLEFFSKNSQIQEVIERYVNSPIAKMVVRSIKEHRDNTTQSEIYFVNQIAAQADELQIARNKLDFDLNPKFDSSRKANNLLQAQKILNNIKKSDSNQKAFTSRFLLRDKDVLENFITLASSEPITPFEAMLLTCISESEERKGFIDFERMGFEISNLKKGGIRVKNLVEVKEFSPADIAKIRIGKPRSKMLGMTLAQKNVVVAGY